jgi:HSP20 family protein
MQPARAEPRERTAVSVQSARPAWPEQTTPEQITWSHVQWRDIMAKLPRPQAPARFRAMFPDLADWLESPWTGPGHVFRLEETIRDNRFMIRAELPGLDPENDIEVRVDGRILTIRAERHQQDTGPYRSEFRYGSLARAVSLPARVDPADVTARYDKGVLEVSVPVQAVKPEGTQIPIENADAVPDQAPDQAG